MSTAGAIEAGQSFVRFFGDMTDLFTAMGKGRKELSAWSKMVGNDAGETLRGGFTVASNAATNFGAQAASASAVASTGLQSVSSNAIAAAGNVSLTSRAFNVFKGAGAGLSGLVGGLGGIAKMTYSLSWILRGTSIGMRLLGKDNSALQPWISTLARVSWGAWGVNTALKAASLTARAARGILGAPLAIAGMAGRGLSRIGRFGGVGMAGASVASAATGGEGEGEGENQSRATGKAVAGGAMMGLMMGGVVGAGIGAAAVGVGLLIKKALSEGAKTGAEEGAGFIAQMGYKLLAFGQWIGETFTKAKDTVLGAFKGMGGGGSFLKDLEKAFFPIIDAVEHVWIPALADGMAYLASFFKGSSDNMSGSWGTFITNSIGGLADFIGNFDLYFQYAQQTLVMWASNALLQVGDFFENAGAWADWFGKNWFDVLTDMANLQRTMFQNVFENLKNLFTSLWEWVKGGMQGDLNFNWTDLTAGFESTIKEWPKLVKTELESSTPEMDRIAAQIATRQAATAKRAEEFEGLKYTPKAEVKKAEKEKAEKEFDSKYGATAAGSQEAYAALARLQNSSAGSPQMELAKRELAESQKQSRYLEKVIDALNRDEGRVWSIA